MSDPAVSDPPVRDPAVPDPAVPDLPAPEICMPLTVRMAGNCADLLVRAPAGTRWRDAAAAVCRAAGLPAGTPLYLGATPLPSGQLLGRPPLLTGVALGVAPELPGDPCGPLVLDCIAGPDAGTSVAVRGDRLVIGRSPGADLTIADPEVSARHASVDPGRSIAGRTGPGGPSLTDLLSTNGTTVGEVPVIDVPVPLPLGAVARIGGSRIRLDLPAEIPLLRHPDGAGHWVLTLPPPGAGAFACSLPEEPGPPPERQRRPLPLIASLATAAAGIGIALITGMWMFLLMAALGPVTMLGTALGDRLSGRRSHRKVVADHAASSARFEAALMAGLAAEQADAWERFADPARLLRWARAGSTRLWERPGGAGREDPRDRLTGGSETDEPQLEVVLRVGAGTSRLEAPGPPVLRDVPLPTALPGHGVLGVCGARRGVLRWLLAQLVGVHPPSALGLRVLSTADDLTALRAVPHTAGFGGAGRVHRRPAELLAALTRSADGGRTTVVVIDGVENFRDDAGISELLRHTGNRTLVIAVADTRAGLPASCVQVIDIDEPAGDHVGVGPLYLRELASALEPFTVAGTGAAGLPDTVLASVADATTLAARWRQPGPPTVVLGAGGSGPVVLDLAADGPHLLIAGTTGSGKSELLQTLIAGLAAGQPPHRLALLLVDYKGGAAFADAARLPHTSGLVTDLDPQLAARALSSLRAEIRSRERLLAAAGVADRDALADDTAPPRLVIVVDEFATLAAELPDFLSGLVDIAQRGRSLGLHLVLATQRPTGVVSPAILANTSARICLRVAEAADSMAVLDSQAPATIPASLPGRGFLRTAGGPARQFQTQRVTAPSADRVQAWPRASPAPPADGPIPMVALIELARAAATGAPLPAPPWLPPLRETFVSHEPTVLGLLDLPEEQQQRPWTLPSGSLLAHGPPGSGRSTLARRWAAAVTATGGHLLVVDPGRVLADLVDARHRAQAAQSYLDATEPALVLRLLTVLADELTERAGVPGTPLGLLIDGFDVLAGALDTLDYGQWQTALGELAGRGPAAGIRVLVTGGPRLAQHRLAASFTQVLSLGSPPGTGPPATQPPPGRGTLSGDAAGELQVALPEPSPAPDNGPSAPAGTGGGGRGRTTPATDPPPRWTVRRLPTSVSIDDLPPSRPGAVPIGIGGDAAVPVFVDLGAGGGALLIAGPRRSGVSTTLAVLGVGAAAAGVPVVRPTWRPTAPVTGVRDLDLRGDADPLRRYLTDHRGPLLLLADDADRFVDQSAGELLVRYLTVAGAGQYLALGARLDQAVRSHRGPIAEAAAFRTGVLLGADAIDGIALDAVLPRRRTPAPPGRAHLVIAGRPIELQVARLD